MKLIVIKDFNKWSSISNPDNRRPPVKNAFRNGYFNVFIFDQKIEDYCKDMNIEFIIKDSDNFSFL